MPPTTNGRPGGILRAGSPVPEKRPIIIERPVVKDGKPLLDENEHPVMADVTLDGWAYGPRCPMSIKIQVMEAAAERHAEEAGISFPDFMLTWIRENEPTQIAVLPDPAAEGDDAKAARQPVDPGWFEKREIAWMRYWGAVLRALVPDLTLDEADFIAGDPDERRRWFVHLGFMDPEKEDGNADDSPPSEEAPRSQSKTSSGSSRGSRRSTARATG